MVCTKYTQDLLSKPLIGDYGVTSTRSTISQTIAVMVKNTLLLTLGMLAGFPTILIPRLLESGTDDPLHITEEEESWIGSIGSMCNPIGCLISGFTTKLLGRKKCMQLVCVQFFVASIGFSIFENIQQMYIALALMGLSAGLLEAPVVTYVAEITQPHLRGILSGTACLIIRLGFFVEFVLGTFYDWRTVAVINAVMPVVSFVLLLTIPESPQWLIMKNKLDEAKASLAWLRGWTTIKNIEQEYNALATAEKSRSLNAQFEKTVVGEYYRKDFIHPLALLTFILLVQSVSGYVTIQRFTVEVFSALKVPINSYYATVIYGGVLVVGSIFCTFGIRRTGKRPMIIWGLMIGGIFTVVLAAYTFSNDLKFLHVVESQDRDFNWAPLICICVASFAQQCGFMIPWILSGELFPRSTSPAGSGIVTAVAHISTSVACKTFLQMVGSITLTGTFCLYGSMCIVGAIVLHFWLPETEGRSLQEITDHFAGVSRLGDTVRRRRVSECVSESGVEKIM